jgi:hypothetical protein
METRGPLDALNAIALTFTGQRRIEAMLAGAEEVVEEVQQGVYLIKSVKNLPEKGFGFSWRRYGFRNFYKLVIVRA